MHLGEEFIVLVREAVCGTNTVGLPNSLEHVCYSKTI